MHDNNVQANPDKFQVIGFGRNRNNIITDFTFNNTTIDCDDSVLLLGVEFDHLLTFNNHIAGICRKSARQLAVLKRLGHLLTLKGKLAIYKSFIDCNFKEPIALIVNQFSVVNCDKCQPTFCYQLC